MSGLARLTGDQLRLHRPLLLEIQALHRVRERDALLLERLDQLAG